MNRDRQVALVVGLIATTAIVYAAVQRQPAVLRLAGVIDADEIVVTPPVQGRLDSVAVVEGSSVAAGQLLALLDRHELAAQAAAAGASAAGARAQLDQATVTAEQAAGEAVGNKASARARLASARADLSRQEASLTQLRTQTSRSAALARSGALSAADLERDSTALQVQEQLVTAARETLRAAEADVQRADAGALSASAAEKAVSSTQARLRGAQADSIAALARLGYTELRAPASGVIQVLVARRGELVGPGAPVAVIIDPSNLWVRVAAPEGNAGGVAVGDSLTVRFPSGQEVRGPVMSKSVVADFATQHDVSASKRDIRAVAFRVAIPNTNGTIVPGMTAEVLLPVHRK